MRPRDRHAGIPDAGRRRFVVAAGWLVVAAPAAWSLVACSSGEEPARKPAAGSAEPEPAAQPARPAEPSAPAPTAAAGGEAAPAADALVTEVPASAVLVKELQYVNQSPKADQRCANCQLFTPRSDDRGKCQMFAEGLVSAGGWCASWAQKVDS